MYFWPFQEAGTAGSQQSVKKLFIGGLKDDTTDDHIREAFDKMGEIDSIDLIKDKGTGKLRGFGFISFKDYDTVDKCCCKFLIVSFYKLYLSIQHQSQKT